jgi:hypothetical protein
MQAQAKDDRVADLLHSVQNGQINGPYFCAEVSKLGMPERTRLLAALLRDYKDLNNFTPATGSARFDKVAS